MAQSFNTPPVVIYTAGRVIIFFCFFFWGGGEIWRGEISLSSTLKKSLLGQVFFKAVIFGDLLLLFGSFI